MEYMNNVQSTTPTHTGALPSRQKEKQVLIMSALTLGLAFLFIILIIANGGIDNGSTSWGLLIPAYIVLLGIIGVKITGLVFIIQLIIRSSNETHEHKTLGLVAGILCLVVSFVGIIMCIIYINKTKNI